MIGIYNIYQGTILILIGIKIDPLKNLNMIKPWVFSTLPLRSNIYTTKIVTQHFIEAASKSVFSTA